MPTKLNLPELKCLRCGYEWIRELCIQNIVLAAIHLIGIGKGKEFWAETEVLVASQCV